jgi:D-glycero-alpha-D-manno-heptose-7-phosphate kinase
VIISRTPLRISLGGGGTDLPTYYEQRDSGYLIAAAIDKYVYVALNQNFDNQIFLRYSSYERADRTDGVQHPILRECLKTIGVEHSIEISSMADIPSGTGLGSSGSFTVGVLKALSQYRHLAISNERLAELACHIEMNVLLEPVGKQDQYIAAMGGLTAFQFRADGTVQSTPVQMEDAHRLRLEDNLLLFFTGLRRAASDSLTEEKRGMSSPGSSNLANLDQMRELGYETTRCLEKGDLMTFGELLTNQWKLKHQRQPSPLHDQIDEWIEEGCQSGAAGGKLVGAGGGGFLLFYAEDKSRLRQAMSQRGLVEVPFHFDYEGSTVLVSR